MRNTINDEKLKEKLTEEDRKVIEELSKEGLHWLESNSMAEPSEIEQEQKKLESKFHPIMTRVYQGAGGEAPAGAEGMPRGYGTSEGAQAPTASADDLD